MPQQADFAAIIGAGLTQGGKSRRKGQRPASGLCPGHSGSTLGVIKAIGCPNSFSQAMKLQSNYHVDSTVGTIDFVSYASFKERLVQAQQTVYTLLS